MFVLTLQFFGQKCRCRSGLTCDVLRLSCYKFLSQDMDTALTREVEARDATVVTLRCTFPTHTCMQSFRGFSWLCHHAPNSHTRSFRSMKVNTCDRVARAPTSDRLRAVASHRSDLLTPPEIFQCVFAHILQSLLHSTHIPLIFQGLCVS
jgi:hypothetical protein